MKCVYIAVILTAVFFYRNAAFSQVLPASRSTNWINAGYPGNTPRYSTVRNILDFGGNANGLIPNDTALAQAISSLSGGPGTIFFPAGTYLFRRPVLLRSQLILKGAGAAQTSLVFNLGGNFNLINITGNATAVSAGLIGTVRAGDSIIIPDNPALFSLNDPVRIYQNDSMLVNDNWALQSVGQIVRVRGILNDQLVLTGAVRRSYHPSLFPRIRKLSMVEGVGIECLKIKRLDATQQQTSNIFFAYASGCWVKGVESDSCNFAHVQIAHSSHILVTNSYFHGAFAYGTGGQGYGISCEYTSGDCLIENNVFRRLRHAMLVQSGANGNVFAGNYSTMPFRTDTLPFDLTGDIVLHGNYPNLNLFEGNIVQTIVLDASHGRNGPFNTFLRNRAERYGFLMAPGMADSTNIIGNEITGTGYLQGNYFTAGAGLLEIANNKNDTILPPGNAILTDRSYFYSSVPDYWNVPAAWSGIGLPHPLGLHSIPAKERALSADPPVYCLPDTPVVYRFTGNGNWSNPLNWDFQQRPPAVLSKGSEIVIETQPGNKCMLDIPFVVQAGVRFRMLVSAYFEVMSSLTFVK